MHPTCPHAPALPAPTPQPRRREPSGAAIAAGLLALVLAPGGAAAQAPAAPTPNEPAGPGLLARQWAQATDLQAWQGEGHWRWAFAPYAPHFRPSDEHRHVWAVAVERQRPDHWLAGLSYFRNSFGQPSGYLYLGKRFPALWGEPRLFGQVSAGMLYGYKGQYQNKVPLNHNGFSPGALVGLGWQFTPRWSLTAHLLGDAGVMFQFAWDGR